MTLRPAPVLPAAALALALAAAAPAASVDLVPVNDALPASSDLGVGLKIEESRGRFYLTFTNVSNVPSASLKIAFEQGLIDALGRPIDLTGDGADFTDRTARMSRQPGSLAPADWQGVGTLLVARGVDPAHGLANTEPDSLTVAFIKHGITMHDLLTRLRTAGSRIGVVFELGNGDVRAATTYLDPAPIIPPDSPAAPVDPRPTPVPSPAAAAMGLALLASQCVRRRR